MKIITLLLLSFFSITAIAHSGHGESSSFAHDLEHALWYVGAISLIAVVFFVAKKSQ